MSKDQIEDRIDELQALLIFGSVNPDQYEEYSRELYYLSDLWGSQEGGDTDAEYSNHSSCGVRCGISDRQPLIIRGRLC